MTPSPERVGQGTLAQKVEAKRQKIDCLQYRVGEAERALDHRLAILVEATKKRWTEVAGATAEVIWDCIYIDVDDSPQGTRAYLHPQMDILAKTSRWATGSPMTIHHKVVLGGKDFSTEGNSERTAGKNADMVTFPETSIEYQRVEEVMILPSGTMIGIDKEGRQVPNVSIDVSGGVRLSLSVAWKKGAIKKFSNEEILPPEEVIRILEARLRLCQAVQAGLDNASKVQQE